jgi:Thiol:disulfide interchange protein DsbD, N-terminal
VVPSHEVFQKPLKVDLKFEDHPVPANYRHYPGGDKLGQTMKVWKVQMRKFPDVDPGMVSDPYGFGDSPDAEVISAGLNSKGPDSVALGRHGNYFLWGFSASPTDMTPGGRKCFINAVCYIKKFDGQKPFVRKTGSGREWALVYAGYAKQYGDKDFVKSLFPEDVRRRFGKDPDKLLAYYNENLEYLIPAQNGFAVDEDVKGLGMSNRKVGLLEKCVALLERGEQADIALRILKRYTTVSLADAKAWRSWLNDNRNRLFFTDVGGFKFLAAPQRLLEPLRHHGPSLTAEEAVPEPDARHPVVATAEVTPATGHPGQSWVVIIRVKLAPAWHIYAAQGPNGSGIRTTLELRLPKAIEADGQWSYPKPISGSDGQMIYEGALEFRRKLRVRPDAAAGPISVACELGYQACNPVSCRPPTKLELVARAEVVEAKSKR